MFYEKVKALCDKNGVSITELAKKLGLSQSNVTTWKAGASPRPKNIKAVSDYFGVPTEYFSNDTINTNIVQNNNHSTVTISNGTTETRQLTEIEAELLRLCGAMDTKQKNELLNIAYSFFDKK